MTSFSRKDTEITSLLQKLFPDATGIRVIPLRSVYLASTPAGNIVIKPLRTGVTQAFLTGKLLAARRRCPVLPEGVHNGKLAYYRGKGGGRYLITRQIPGREADYRNVEDLATAIRTMREFHRYGRSLLREDPNPWRMLRFVPDRMWEKAFREMEQCRKAANRSPDAWSKEYLKLWHYYSRQGWEAINGLPAREENGEAVICYHDWAFHNVIIARERGYLIDFDLMVVDRPVHDRANLISRYLRLHNWSVEALMKVLWNFDRFYPWKKGEIQRLRSYLLFPYDYWMLGRQFFLEKQPWSPRYYSEQWRRKIAPYREREKVLQLLERIEK
jgi:CotS family spore coat protein